MIRKRKNKIVLLSTDGGKKLGEWGFSTDRGEKVARTKAKKREQQINYFKHK